MGPTLPSLGAQLAWLALLALPVACVAWTITHEEIFREPRAWCRRRCERAPSLLERKFFYLFTCEYCFSHWVALAFVALFRFRLLVPDWRGYVAGFFALVWVANVYVSVFAWLRQGLKHETLEAKRDEIELEEQENGDVVPGRGEGTR